LVLLFHRNLSDGYPVLFALKDNDKLRLCIDIKKLNKITIRNSYLMLLTVVIFNKTSSHKYYSKKSLIWNLLPNSNQVRRWIQKKFYYNSRNFIYILNLKTVSFISPKLNFFNAMYLSKVLRWILKKSFIYSRLARSNHS